jgi:hypothetical protein
VVGYWFSDGGWPADRERRAGEWLKKPKAHYLASCDRRAAY